MFPSDIIDLARQVIEDYADKKLRIVTAESCTGGLLCAALTEIPGASKVVERAFVSYGNDAKIEVLAVMPEVLSLAGAVSADVAEDMAKGALEFSQADVAVSITGVAGPDGGTPIKPVGLVYFGIATQWGFHMHFRCQFGGDRSAVRLQAVKEALKILLSVRKD